MARQGKAWFSNKQKVNKMKLWTIDEEGVEKVIDVKYWSFFKCQFLVYVVLCIFIWLIAFFLGLMLIGAGV